MKYIVIYKSYTIKHEVFTNYFEAKAFYEGLLAEGCEAVMKVK